MAQYYFAYGADLDSEDLGLRCEIRRRQRVRFAKSSPAVLKGFRLVCNIPSHYRQGGIFNILPDPADAVHGVVYELHPGDAISAAMVKEGESSNYLLGINTVLTAKGKTLQALVLRAEAKSKSLTPSPAYLEVVIRAARRHGLPPEWITRLRDMAG
ncbi:MAG: hypothetical protein A2992_09485 [Elusimicrobia bacterium RIFCSPLOWO2_01_FULL_59_12]|nr:MAG: hypothetical protein A2992_09485 [Elusimicrobia bacterium RIFCSPLOWO2_01_FULL_59_12]